MDQHNSSCECVRIIENFMQNNSVVTKFTSLTMLIETFMFMASWTLATGVVIRLFVWYSGSNNCVRKRSSSGFDFDSMK